jgi:hypothetical protein
MSDLNAFPELMGTEQGDVKIWNTKPGMSLRDYFAGQAIAGFCANNGFLLGSAQNKPSEVAINAYKVADAMLKERGETV